MSAANELQQEIIQAEAKVNELREKLNQQNLTERLQTITSIKELIKRHQLAAAELGFTGKNAAKSKKVARSDKGIPVAPKYVDSATGKTWAGRGRIPAWLVVYLSNGRSKDDYLVAAT